VVFESEKCFGELAKSLEYGSGVALISFQAKID